MTAGRAIGVAAIALATGLIACGGGGSAGASSDGAASSAATLAPSGSSGANARPAADWTRFGFDAARYNDAPHGIGAAAVSRLQATTIGLPGTVDSSPIFLAGAKIHGHRRNVLVMTTTYGKTMALDATSGRRLWTFTPRSYGSVAGSAQITTATPVGDPNRRFVYAASPDGVIHKLRLRNGHQVSSRAWPTSVTRDPKHEKIASALNLSGRVVLVTTGGYIGDAPPYQGKVVAISRSSGKVVHVVNSLCSNRHRIFRPSTCGASDSAIWGRGGAVVDPNTKRIYVATGNAPFDGHTDWGDSVLELGRGGAPLRRHYTPANQQQLNSTDGDLGSASPALLPAGGRAPKFVLQGGKDGKLRLLRISSSFHRVHGRAGERLGGEVQTLPTPAGEAMFTAPAVLHGEGRTLVFVATGGGTAAYRLHGGRLHQTWSNGTGGTSPVLAGHLLWVYDPSGDLVAYRPASGRAIRHLPVPSGHWNSPIVDGGRVYVPSGDANDHSTRGTLTIYH